MFKCLFIDSKGWTKVIELHDIYPTWRIPYCLPLESSWESLTSELGEVMTPKIQYVEFIYCRLENGFYIYREIL